MRLKDISKKRDPNWKTLQDKRTSGAAGAHKDKKRAEKQGDVKHKKPMKVDERFRDPEDWDEGNTEPANNFAIHINGKKWKVFPAGNWYADSLQERNRLHQLQDWCRKKSEATGKQWTVHLTGEAATA